MKKRPDNDAWKQLAGMVRTGLVQAATDLRERLIDFDTQWAKQGLQNFSSERDTDEDVVPGDGEWHLHVVPGAYASFSDAQVSKLQNLGVAPHQLELSGHHQLPDGVRVALHEAPVGMGVAWLVDPDGHTKVVLQTPVKPRGWERLLAQLSAPPTPESS